MLLGQNWIFTLDFNPRPRKEGDAFLSALTALINYFNPRPRKEGD